jgi:16S rRNA (guanine527-N7)-methyltransferase
MALELLSSGGRRGIGSAGYGNGGQEQVQTIRTPEDFATACGVPPETIERLVLYEKLLRQWQKAVNLVAPATLDSIWHRHFADSAQLVRLVPPGTRTWLDLGSGAGFPGLVAAIVLAGTPPAYANPLPASGGREPGIPRFTLIESDSRKCAFLREVVRQTGVVVDILSRRVESVRTSVNEDLPRIVSARAVAPLDRLLELAAPLSPPGTTLLLPKGREVAQELQLAESRWQFQVALVPSVTDTHGRIAVITNLERKAKD